MSTKETTPATATDLETLKAAAREVVKEAEEGEKHKNGSSDKSAETAASENGADSDSNGVHENGSAGVTEDEEMDTNEENETAEENDEENEEDVEEEEDEEGEAENGSAEEGDPLADKDPLDEDSAQDEESRDQSEQNGDNEDEEEDSNDEGEKDPLASNIHTDNNKDKAVNGKSDKAKVNGDTVQDLDEDSDGSDDIIIEKDNTVKANPIKKLVTPKKKKIEEVTLDESPLRRSSRKKTPTKYADEDQYEVEEVSELVQDIEEIADDDSDIMEVENDDPLTQTPSMASISITKSTKSSAGKKPNVVTIDDLKTLQLLATSAKRTIDSQKKENRLDTQAILAGKMGSGVSITPARPKLNIGAAGLTLNSGVTIKPNTPKASPVIPSSVTITNTSSSNSSTPRTPSAPSPVQQQQQDDYDPNLTDDTFVVEAPSFIVPYVYEKPPKEEIKAFLEEIKKLKAELVEKDAKEVLEKKNAKKEEQKKRREARQKRRDEEEKDVSDDSEEEEIEEVKVKDEKDNKKDDTEKDKTEEDTKEGVKKEEEKKVEVPKTASQLYFDSTLGKFFGEIGMNLVQEYVQRDLLASQKKRAHRDKSVAVLHAISSLSKNLDDSEETNSVFHHDMRKCRFCSFRTESRIVMANHMETPHMRNFIYRCNFCEFETKIPQEVLFHMDSIHGVKGKLERAPYYHQCPQCSFEDNGKGKLTRHRMGCDKRFKPEHNLNPDRDWEPPAKIRAIIQRPGYPMNMNVRGGQMSPGMMQGGMRQGNMTLQARNISPAAQRMGMMSAASRNAALANRGRPVGTYKGQGYGGVDLRIPQPNMNAAALAAQQNKLRGMSPQMMSGQQMLAALNSQGLSVLGSKNNSPGGGKGGSPSISITPLPGRNSPATKKAAPSPQMKPGQPGGTGKGSFVICEICDGYIKDLEQLRNHMQWIHKVKIHPKMIHNRPPLNCQKCQFRFFTDQGLERHLLGSHGLVTASMQDAANKGQDSGRCPVCGKVYQWKLLNHVAKDHNKTLKPAHLSYKCTVCTATFGQYKLFENHVYTAHSGVAKKADKNKQGASSSGVQKPVSKPTPPPQPKKQPGKAEVIDLDDEDEIDDVEKDEKKKTSEVIDLDSTPTKKEGGVKRSNPDKPEESSKKVKVTEEKDPLAVDSPEEEEKEDDNEASADD